MGIKLYRNGESNPYYQSDAGEGGFVVLAVGGKERTFLLKSYGFSVEEGHWNGPTTFHGWSPDHPAEDVLVGDSVTAVAVKNR